MTTSTSSPAALVTLLHGVVADAIGVSTDAADARFTHALADLLQRPDGPLADLKVQITPTERVSVPPPAQPPMPVMPGMLSALDPGSLGLGPARSQLLARMLLGARDPEALASAIAHHPIVASMVRLTRLGPLPHHHLVAGLSLDHPELGMAEPDDAWAVCAALLELATAARVPGRATPVAPFEVSVVWTLSGSSVLSRRLGTDPTDPPVVALAPPKEDDPHASWAPAMACRRCGVDGIGFVLRDGQPHTHPTDVLRAFRLGNERRRFVALDPDLRQAGPPCPRCGGDDGIAPLALPAGALFAWATVAATFHPDCPTPSAPEGMRAPLTRMDFRLAIRDAIGGQARPLEEVLDAVVEQVRGGPDSPLAAANDTALRFGALSELTVGARRGVSLGRAGLAAIGLAPDRLDRVPEKLRGAVVLTVQRLIEAGAVWDDAIEPCVAAGGNAALLPCPVGDGVPAPQLVSMDENRVGLRGVVREHCGRIAHPDVDSAVVLGVLQEVRALRNIPGMRLLALDPAHLVVFPATTAVSCSHRHRAVDLPAPVVSHAVGLPCFTPRCREPLVAHPRAYGGAVRWLEQAVRGGVRIGSSQAPVWTVHPVGGRLQLRLAP